MKAELDKMYMMDFLKSNDLGVLTTVDDKGNPAAAPMYHLTQDDFSLLFATRAATDKIKNIKKNPNAVYTLTNTGHNETIQIKGKMEFVNPDEMKVAQAFDALAKKFTKLGRANVYLALLSHKGSDVVLLKLKPKSVRMRRYYEGGIDEKELTKF